MNIDVGSMRARFGRAQAGKQSRHSIEDRTRPSLLQYDYLTLSTLSEDVTALIGAIPRGARGRRALDLGADKCPYRRVLEANGCAVETLDVTADGGADHVGTAEATGLPGESFDVVVCTQVLEHCVNPWQAISEIQRVLKPGGHLVLSVPHVWFYHPHPADNWRFTQEGVVQLCGHAGLAVTELRAQGGSLLTLGQIANFMLYGVAGRYGAPVYAAVNVATRLADGLISNELFCHNFACLAERR